MRSLFLFIFIVLGVCRSESAIVQHGTFGAGVDGWCTELSGSSDSHCYGSASAACQAEFDSYMANGLSPNSRLIGPVATTSWRSVICKWTYAGYLCPEESGGGINGCLLNGQGGATFNCKSGYTSVSPGLCLPEYEAVKERPVSCKAGDRFEQSLTPNRGNTSLPAVGNPITLMSGAKYDEIIDFQTSDARLQFGRYYRSVQSGNTTMRALPVGLTSGWRHNFSMELHLSDEVRYVGGWVYLHAPDGSSYTFARQSSGAFSNYTGISWSLPQSDYNVSLINPPSDMTTILQAPTDWVITDSNDRKWTLRTMSDVNASPARYYIARPIQIVERDGYTINLTYGSDGALQSVTDTFGRTITFAWHTFYTTPLTGVSGSMPSPLVLRTASFPDGTSLEYIYDIMPSATAPTTAVPKNLVSVERRAPAPGSTPPYTVTDSSSYHYENPLFDHALTGITDGRGVRFSTYAYDDIGRAVATEYAGPSGAVEKYTIAYAMTGPITSRAFLRTVTGPLGKQAIYRWTTNNGYIGASNLVAVEGQASANCPAATGSFAYSSSMLQTRTDEEGRQTRYVRDSLGRPTSTTYGYGSATPVTVTTTWHATLNQPTQIVEPGLTTTYNWHATTGLLTSMTQTDTTSQTVPYSTNGQTRTWAYTYGAGGKLLTTDGPLAGAGDTTTYTYDAQGYLKTITNEVGHLTTINTVNGRGQPTQVTDPNSVVTNYGYDPVGRLNSIIVEPGATQAVWSMTYTGAGDVDTLTTPTGLVYTFTWDSARRLTAVQNSLNERIEYTRDAASNVTATNIRWGAAGATQQTTTYMFDELSRMIRQTGQLSRIWKYGYDKTSNLNKVTDPRNQDVTYGYDAVSRLVTETERDTGVTTVTYDGQNNPVTYKDPRNLTTTFVRNGFGEVIQEVSPDRGATTFVRDARGLVTQMTDARAVVTNFTYDNAGRILTRTYPAATAENVTYTYDNVTSGNKGKGRLTGMTDQSGTSAYVYNAKGKLVTETRVIAAKTYVTNYGWSNSGLLNSITYPSGRIVTYTNNALGQVTAITTKATSTAAAETILTGITYLPLGPLAGGNFGNGLTLTKSWDSDYQPNGIKVAPTAGGTSLMQRWHWFDTDFMNLTTLNDNDVTPAETQNFTYDNVGRLASASSGAYGTRAYTYDKVGNRLSETVTPPGGAAALQSYTYPATSNRLTSITLGASTTRSLVYDAAGNITTDTRAGTAWNYTINKAGRLASVKQGATAKGDYVYDGRQRLATRVVSNVTGANGTSHILHGYVGCPEPMNENALQGGSPCDRILAETDGTGPAGTKREYIWLGDMPVAVIDKTVTPNKTLMVHADHLNRPYFMTDSTRAVVFKAVYEPFGAVYSTTGTATLNTLRFPGQWFQLESGLAYNWHRHYDATLGRYVSADPLGVYDGPSVYGYVGQAPLEGVDDTGLYDIHRDGGVIFKAYPGTPAGGTEHGPPHVHLKDMSGNEVRVSTKTWTPLPGEPTMSRDMQQACNRLSAYDKGFIYRTAMRIYGTGYPTVQQVLRIQAAQNLGRTAPNFNRFSPRGLE